MPAWQVPTPSERVRVRVRVRVHACVQSGPCSQPPFLHYCKDPSLLGKISNLFRRGEAPVLRAPCSVLVDGARVHAEMQAPAARRLPLTTATLRVLQAV